MSAHSAPGVEQEDREAFAVWIEVWIGGNVSPPVFGGFVWRVAEMEVLRQRAFAQ